MKMIDQKRLKKIKLVVFDLDGTLLDSHGEIGDETIELIGELEKYDVVFSFASGRLQNTLTEHAELLNIRTPLISLDGSLIKNHPDGDTIFEAYVPKKYVKKAIDLSDEFLLKIALCHQEAIYFTEYNSLIPDMLDKFGSNYKKVHSYDNYIFKTLEVVLVGDSSENIRYAYERMNFPYAFGLNTNYYRSQSHGGLYYIEIRKKGISKGTGLKRLAKHLGMNIKHTAIIGDWYNDLSLFQTDALKIAVKNAVPEIKRLADFVTKRTNDEDATAEFLKKLLQAKKS